MNRTETYQDATAKQNEQIDGTATAIAADTTVVGAMNVDDVDKNHDGYFEIGERVKINGLKGAAQYNGTYGVIEDWDEEDARWAVKMELDGAQKLLKPDNCFGLLRIAIATEGAHN